MESHQSTMNDNGITRRFTRPRCCRSRRRNEPANVLKRRGVFQRRSAPLPKILARALQELGFNNLLEHHNTATATTTTTTTQTAIAPKRQRQQKQPRSRQQILATAGWLCGAVGCTMPTKTHRETHFVAVERRGAVQELRLSSRLGARNAASLVRWLTFVGWSWTHTAQRNPARTQSRTHARTHARTHHFLVDIVQQRHQRWNNKKTAPIDQLGVDERLDAVEVGVADEAHRHEDLHNLVLCNQSPTIRAIRPSDTTTANMTQ